MQTKPDKKQNYFFNLGNLFAISLVLSVTYYILLGSSDQPLSIAFLLARSKHLTYHCYLLVIGLIPIYIGLLIFGAAILGLYCGYKIHWTFNKN